MAIKTNPTPLALPCYGLLLRLQKEEHRGKTEMNATISGSTALLT